MNLYDDVPGPVWPVMVALIFWEISLPLMLVVMGLGYLGRRRWFGKAAMALGLAWVVAILAMQVSRVLRGF